MAEEDKTIVVFRKYPDGGVVALFPEIREGIYVGSYGHIGQHGAADYHYVVERTRPATPSEYRALKRELETIGYNLDVRKRHTRSEARIWFVTDMDYKNLYYASSSPRRAYLYWESYPFTELRVLPVEKFKEDWGEVDMDTNLMFVPPGKKEWRPD